MFCPQCGQERISQETNYCSRCGFLLTVTSELLPTGGTLPEGLLPAVSPTTLSPRSRGVRQGAFMFLLTFVVAPIVGFLSMAIGLRPWPVGIVVALLAFGGLLRMAYALLFEPGYSTTAPSGAFPKIADAQLSGRAAQASLPPQQTYPASEYTSPQPGHWRDTNDLEPTSVTETTTKLLDKKQSESPE
jgi:hypothetical protein